MSRNICLICLHSQTACHCYGARCTCLARRKSGWSWRLPKSSGGGPWIARVAPLGMRSSHSKTLITLKTWQWWSVSRCFKSIRNHFSCCDCSVTGWRLGGGGWSCPKSRGSEVRPIWNAELTFEGFLNLLKMGATPKSPWLKWSKMV